MNRVRLSRHGFLGSSMVVCVVVSLSVLLATTARSESPPVTVSEMDFLQPFPLVISPTQLIQPSSEAPVAVTVITREDIEAMGVRHIVDLLRRVPGMTVAYENGSNAFVSYQGLNDGFQKRMQVLVDGRSVYDPFFGGVFWANLPVEIEDIDRIEVIRGPNAAIDGANAFLATISITTRHASQDPGRYVKARVGNNDIRDLYVRYGATRDMLSYRISSAYRQDEGLQTRQDDSHIRYLAGRLDWNLTPTRQLTVQAGFKNVDLQQGFETEKFSVLEDPFEACFPVHNRPLKDYYGQLRFDSTPAANEQLTFQAYYSRRSSHFDFTRPVACGGFYEEDDYTIERYDAELRYLSMPRDDMRVIGGVGTRLDRVDVLERVTPNPASPFVNQHDNFSVRLFGHVEWRATENGLLNVGAMLERNSITGDTELSPRLAWNIFFGRNHTVRFGIARGIRTPAFVEEDWQGDFYFTSGGLAAETILSREIGYVGYFPDYRLSLDARVFWNRVDDLITANPAVFPFNYVNQGNADIKGVEMQAAWQLTRATRLHLAYAYTTIDSDDPFGIQYSASNPDQMVDVFLVHQLTDTLQTSLAYNFASRMEWLYDGTPVPASHLLDFRLAKRLKIDGRSGGIAVKVNNVLDNQKTFKETNEWGRRMFLEVELDF